MAFPKPPPYSPLRRDHPLAQGLVGAWPMWEGAGGTVYDATGRGNNGTLNGTDKPYWVGRSSGLALQFHNNTDDNVAVANHAVFNTATLSIAAGVWRDDTTVLRGIIEKTPGTGYGAWGLIIQFQGRLGFHANNGGTVFAGATVLPAGSLLHVGFSTAFAGVTNAIYLNGIVDGTGVINTGKWGVTSYYIKMGTYLGAAALNGYIDYIYMWNCGQPADTFAQITSDPFAMFRPRKRWWYTSGAATIHDISGSLTIGSAGSAGGVVVAPVGGALAIGAAGTAAGTVVTEGGARGWLAPVLESGRYES